METIRRSAPHLGPAQPATNRRQQQDRRRWTMRRCTIRPVRLHIGLMPDRLITRRNGTVDLSPTCDKDGKVNDEIDVMRRSASTNNRWCSPSLGSFPSISTDVAMSTPGPVVPRRGHVASRPSTSDQPRRLNAACSAWYEPVSPALLVIRAPPSWPGTTGSPGFRRFDERLPASSSNGGGDGDEIAAAHVRRAAGVVRGCGGVRVDRRSSSTSAGSRAR